MFEKSPSDTTLLPMVLERHEDIFGEKIKNLAADMGFRPKEEKFSDLSESVEYLAVPKRLSDWGDSLLRL